MVSLKRLYFGLIQKAKKVRLSNSINNINVLMFHDIYLGDSVFSPLDISSNNFVYFFQELLERKVCFCKIDSIFIPNDATKYTITFDDVHESVYSNAIPFLIKHSIPFTLFIANAFINQNGYLTSRQILELTNNPLCTIGFHSNSHVIMRGLDKTSIKKEIDCSELMHEYSVDCDYFAYPYGSIYACSNQVIKTVKDSGRYKAAFGTINCSTNYKTITKEPFYIPRLTVSDQTWKNIIN